jgi:hypothetical protein
MEHFEDFGIDFDEGRDIDPREAFYANALPCESCGEPCEDRQTATWDPSLQVGPCCQFDAAQIPELPVCEELYKLTMRAKTVGELMDIRRAHQTVCQVCNPDAQEIREAA